MRWELKEQLHPVPKPLMFDTGSALLPGQTPGLGWGKTTRNNSDWYDSYSWPAHDEGGPPHLAGLVEIGQNKT